MRQQRGFRQWHGALLSLILLMSGQPLAVQAQHRKPLTISFGQPNIWSLEQAHYLLARMRFQSLDLQARRLTEDDLDPNATNATRVEILRTLLGISAGFDAVSGLQNELFANNARFNLARRQELLTSRDQLLAQQSDAVARLARLNVERAGMNGDGFTPEARALKDAEITAATAVRDQINTRVNNINSELGSLGAAPSSPTPIPSPPDITTSRLTESITNSIINTNEFRGALRNDTQLAASTKLDNNIQLQYEIIAKQLTLLRDEVGPGERLVFLELPHSIYTVPDKSKRQLAQVWWRVEGYYKRPDEMHAGTDPWCEKAKESRRPEVLEREAASLERKAGGAASSDERLRLEAEARKKRGLAKGTLPDPLMYEIALRCNPYSADRPIKQSLILARTAATRMSAAKGLDPEQRTQRTAEVTQMASESVESDARAVMNNDSQIRQIRTVDLIPRQSSLNVNDIQDKVKNFNLAGAFSFLFGLGARVNFERRRETYEQFIHQDIFASGFGKGDRDFGWTFGPVPGTDHVAPGLHTTYAVLIVPDDAEAIKLKARGCSFPRNRYAPRDFDDTDENGVKIIGSEAHPTTARGSDSVRCDDGEDFRIAIPGTTENNFWVTGIEYRQVKPGSRAVIFLRGDYFSPQIGVLVDGVPLRRAVGVAQVELAATKNDSFQPRPRGEFEMVNSKQIVLAFTMPDGYEGTPVISLVTPGRARTINDLRLVINDSYKEVVPDPAARKPTTRYKTPDDDSKYVKLEDQPPLFSSVTPEAEVALTGVEVLRPRHSAEVTLYLSGVKFDRSDRIEVNGRTVPDAKKTFRNSRLWELKFDTADEESWTIAVFPAGEKAHALRTFLNPGFLKVSGSPQVVKYVPAVEKKTEGLLVVKLSGSGFTPTVVASVSRDGKNVPVEFRRISPTEAVVEITAPQEFEVVTLSDRGACSSAGVCVSTSTAVVRPSSAVPSPPAASPSPAPAPTP